MDGDARGGMFRSNGGTVYSEKKINSSCLEFKGGGETERIYVYIGVVVERSIYEHRESLI